MVRQLVYADSQTSHQSSVTATLRREGGSRINRRGNPFLGFVSGCNRLRWKLEHRRFLTLQQVIQQHHLPVGKFQRIMMGVWVVLVDLPKDGCRVIDYTRFPTEQPATAVASYRSWRSQVLFPEERKPPCCNRPAKQSLVCQD